MKLCLTVARLGSSSDEERSPFTDVLAKEPPAPKLEALAAPLPPSPRKHADDDTVRDLNA